MNAQGCFLELEKQTGYGRMIFKYCKKQQLSLNLGKFKVKSKNYKKLTEKSNSFKTIKSVTSLTIC